MAKEVVLPQLGQTMKEGTLTAIRVSEGDHVEIGSILFEIETDKATLEMESPAEGYVKAVLVEAGKTVPIHTPLLVLGEQAEQIDPAYLTQLEWKVQAVVLNDAPVRQTAPVALTAQGVRAAEAEARCSPLARPTGAQSIPSLGRRVPLSRLQKIIAEKMLWSKQHIPCFYLNVRVDATRLVELRAKMNADSAAKFSFNDFIIRALALGIKHYPIMSGQLAGDHIQLSEKIDIGLAIGGDEGGVVAPIVKDCGSKTLADISRTCRELVERTHTNKLSLDDLTGGCISVSNLGAFGVDSFIPIVIPGQTSILGVGSLQDMAAPADGKPATRTMMNLTLSVDHKVVNGAEAAQFLDFVKKLLEHPDELL
jgi:pyruvate dehydrogenase E2 component (dihydrolipoamide acetyltransferase)